MISRTTQFFASTAVASALLVALVPGTASAGNYGYTNQPITVYFTRHAEKKTTTTVTGSASTTYELDYSMGGEPMANNEGGSVGDQLDEVCGTDKCAEELNAFGLVRADLLEDYFTRRGITRKLDAVYSSHKERTRQTVAPTAAAAGLEVIQLPMGGTELEPEGTTPSECPTIEAILNANPGDTLLVAGHSGTLYDIMGDGNDDCAGLGLDTSDDDRFPKDAKGKVRDFGDIWKITIRNGKVRFNKRVNLGVKRLVVMDRAN